MLPNAGFGTWGTCSDPTTLRGLSIGAVDEYDQTDPGQAITIGSSLPMIGLPSESCNGRLIRSAGTIGTPST